jgi:metallophosphoesterase (TIGR03767 family)
MALFPDGTTLESTVAVTATDPTGYVHLGVGPGWPIVTRNELSPGGGAANPTPVATIGHLTDIHLVDCQSPGRVEFLDRIGSPVEGAYRAQEPLSTQVGSAMVERMNAVGRGPIAGRAIDCVVSTGDSIDNQQHNELGWFMTLMDGGHLVPDSGAIGRYEGVQDGNKATYDVHYWHPGPVPAGKKTDDYKKAGFPTLPGFLDSAIAGFDTPGLDAPWYSTYGNHDGLMQGNVAGVTLGLRPFDPILTGCVKVTGLSILPSVAKAQALLGDLQGLLDLLLGIGAPSRIVTADHSRRAVSPHEWINAHLASPTGDHGFTEDHLECVNLDYTFPVDDEGKVLGISLDTTNHGGYADGSLGQSQLTWLENRLREVSSSYRDSAGVTVNTGNADRLVVLFSHHNLGTVSNVVPDPAAPLDRRLGAPEILAVLRRFPNVIAWVNGHTHVNRVNPVPDPSGYTGGFWEITTAAHIDFPEQSRIIEIVDNGDQTLSIFATVLEHAGAAVVDVGDTSPLGLASLSRELSANDPQTDRVGKLGTPTDLNVELVVRAPFTL